MPERLTTPEETGRYLVFYAPDNLENVSREVSNLGGLRLPSQGEAAMAISGPGGDRAESSVAPSLGVAVVSADPDQVMRIQSAGSHVRSIRKEYIFRIADPDFRTAPSADYLRGYQDGVNSLIGHLMGETPESLEAQVQDILSFRDNDDFTWGLQSTGVNAVTLSGKGVRIAVLDTGFDMEHPDFKSRGVQSKSFVSGAAMAQDDNGHGTHCLGTVGGPAKAAQGRRYGIASDATLFVGKVMDKDGFGKEWDILQGMEWAIQNQCRIISLSLGKPVAAGAQPDNQYEQIGKAALMKNCLIVAAAGNESMRPRPIRPVDMPANASRILAVGAIDRHLAIFPKSNAGLNGNGGKIDLVGPGVEVYSSLRGGLYGNDSGTSMATPHVSGVAALFMEADPAATAEQIWARLSQAAQHMTLSSADAGSGLVRVSQ